MSTKENFEREAQSASDKLHEASDTIKSSAHEYADEAKRTANAYAEQGMATAAGRLNDFASAVRRASDELNQRDQDFAAHLVSHAASSLEDIASSVSHTSMDEVVTSVKGFARRNPAVFVGGAVLAGLAAGRFLRASGERPHYPPTGQAAQHTGYTPPASYTPQAARPPVAPANSTPK